MHSGEPDSMARKTWTAEVYALKISDSPDYQVISLAKRRKHDLKCQFCVSLIAQPFLALLGAFAGAWVDDVKERA